MPPATAVISEEEALDKARARTEPLSPLDFAEAWRADPHDDGDERDDAHAEGAAVVGDAADTEDVYPSAAAMSPVATAFLTLGTIGAAVVFLLFHLRYSNNISDTFLDLELPQKIDVLSRTSWIPGASGDAQLVVASVMAVSAFAQALTGFGFAVISVGALSSMPWLLHSELYEVITPVAATLGALVGAILLLPNVRNLAWREILPLLIPCCLLTPVGIAAQHLVSPQVATKVLSVLILAFVAYETWLMSASAPQAEEEEPAPSQRELEADAADAADVQPAEERGPPLTAVAFGSLAGLFGGAFDVQGPPLVLYGNSKGWNPRMFRDNILTVVAVNSALIILLKQLQGAEGGLADFYYSYFCLTSLPGVLVGVACGQYVADRIDKGVFQFVVLGMCLCLGVNLLAAS